MNKKFIKNMIFLKVIFHILLLLFCIEYCNGQTDTNNYNNDDRNINQTTFNIGSDKIIENLQQGSDNDRSDTDNNYDTDDSGEINLTTFTVDIEPEVPSVTEIVNNLLNDHKIINESNTINKVNNIRSNIDDNNKSISNNNSGEEHNNLESFLIENENISLVKNEFDENLINNNNSENIIENNRNHDIKNINENFYNNDDNDNNYIRVSRQHNNNNYENYEYIELLEKYDPLMEQKIREILKKLKNSTHYDNVEQNKIYLHHKHGSKIIEIPSYNEMPYKKPDNEQRSLIIIFDGTSSMFDDLKQLTDGAEAIINEITQREKNPIYNYIFVPFRDEYVGPKLVTQNLDRLLDELRNLELLGGGDCPESPIGGINLALESALPKSLIYVFTDATAKDYGLDQITIDLIQKHQATLTFLLTGFCNSPKSDKGYYVYEKLAALSNGQIFNLNKTDIKEVLESIRISLDDDLIPLNYMYSKEPGQHSIDIPVDQNLKELTVSVAGKNPNITLTDPNQTKQPSDVNEILNLSNLKVVNVHDPIPGTWNVETISDSEHSVKLTGLSNLKFDFGFSTEYPQNLNETNLNPVKNIPNILSVAPSDDNLINELISIELVPIEYNSDNKNNLLPLKYLGPNENLNNSSIYTTKPFIPPKNMFKVYVRGIDSQGNQLKYLLSTAIKAEDGEKPKISTTSNYVEFLEGHDGGQIECKVISRSPAKLTWKKNNEIITSENISGTKVYYQKFNKITLEDSGSYVCHVENEHGSDEQIINVIVKENIIPINVKLMQPYMVIKENEVDYQINCFALPSDNVKYSWFFGDKELKNNPNIEISSDNLVIKHIERWHTGNYTCKASNGRTSNEDTAYMDVLFGPEILSPDDEYITVRFGELITLNCDSIGNPTPTAEWILPDEVADNEIFDNLTHQTFVAKIAGSYYCRISNGVEDDKEKYFHVLVEEKPNIQNIFPVNHQNDKLLEIIPGETVKYVIMEGYIDNIFCKAAGYPTPIVYWIKRNEITGEEIIETNENLSISNAKLYDSGKYICAADNLIGQDRKQIDLFVVAPPKFKSTEDAVIMVEKGQQVILNCGDIDGFPIPKISWNFNNNSLDVNDTNYIFENTSLTFNANFKDSGIYECLAKNQAGQATKKIILIVYVPPYIYPPDDEIIFSKMNQNTKIRCNVEGYPMPNISWFKHGLPLEETERIHLNDNSDELILVDTIISDTGTYTCEAQNNHGIAQKSFYLNVNFKPKITTQLPEVVKLLPFESISLNCNGNGEPSPDIFWKKDNKIILEEKILDIINSEPENVTGVYSCFIQNSEGYDEKFIEIIGIRKPTIDEDEINSNNRIINSTLYEDVKIFCPMKNAISYTWYKDGEKLFDEYDQVLQIDFVLWDERGNYTCIGTNEAGSTEYTQELSVWMTPKFLDNSNENTSSNEIENKIKPKTIELKLGEDVTLKCSAQGFPEPEIIWRKDKTELSRNQELHLKNVQIIHSGEYTCVAKNEFGENEISYIMDVQVSPSIQGPKNNWIEVSENDDLKLECNLIGNPQPKIYWMKNGANLTNEYQEILEINDPKIEDSGQYKCIGTNNLGEEEITFNVDILAPPKFITPKRNIKIQENDSLELACTVEANPLPIVAWSFNNKVIWSTSSIPLSTETEKTIYTDRNGNPVVSYSSYPNDTISNPFSNLDQYGKLTKKNHTLTAYLVIEDPSKKKPGVYKCHSINSLGSQETDFHVQINYPPILKGTETDRKPSVNITVLEDLPLILYCPWQGDPKPKITWIKNNEPIRDYDHILSKDMKTLTIFNANLNRHSGEYVCTAVNDLGESQKNFHVKVLVPPKFEQNNDVFEEDIIPYTHVIGQQTVLDCPVTGNPPPTIFWLQQTDDKYNRNDFEILVTNSSQLILDDIKTSGIYSCYANNSLGFIEKKYSVEVQRVPFINSDLPKQQTFKEYQTITIQCPAEGTPKPIISWYKDGISVKDSIKNAQFSSDKTILKIPNARKELSGTYTCFATNALGEVRQDTQITIKTPVTWSKWESWTPCSKSCGTGIKSRRRRCLQLNGEPANNENECIGSNYESEMCEMLPCPVDGGWSEWSEWNSCSKQCTDINDTYRPTRKRYRECNSPKPIFGGKHCAGMDYEEQICNVNFCPIDGGWSDWTAWSPCSVTCGTGRKERYRKCNNPIPAYGGHLCRGRYSDAVECFSGPCSIHGGWSEWSAWSECSKTCGTGFKKRTRTCTNPVPKDGGNNCPGENVEIVKCRERKCLNSSLLKSLRVKNPYGPAAEYDVPSLYYQDYSDEEDERVVAPDESKYQFALSSKSEIKTPDIEEQKSEFISHSGMKVVVTLKKYHPIDKDTKEINLHPGLAPFKIERILPCPFGFEPDENNQCKDVNECLMESICDENEACKNIEGGFICSCKSGYKYDDKKGKCVDIDECANESRNDCSHTCKNTPGSYICTCPNGYMLNPDKKGCGPDPLYLAQADDNEFLSDSAFINSSTNGYTENDCSEGYYRVNGVCKDIDECARIEHDCGYEQKCLNIKGSYLCIPTPCTEEYIKDERTGNCVLMCDEQFRCSENAKIAEILTYIPISLEKFKISEPFYTLVNFDLNRNVLYETIFILDNNNNSNKNMRLFKLETHELKKGIAYLSATGKLKKDKLYNVRITAKSYDPKTFQLIYITKFVIYLYLL